MGHDFRAQARALSQLPIRIPSVPQTVYCRVLWSIDSFTDASMGAVVDENGNDLGGVVAIDGVRGLQICQPQFFGDVFYQCVPTTLARRSGKSVLRPVRFAGVGPAGATACNSVIDTGNSSVKLHDVTGNVLTTTISGVATPIHLPWYATSHTGYQYTVASLRFSSDTLGGTAAATTVTAQGGYMGSGSGSAGVPLTINQYVDFGQTFEVDFWYEGSASSTGTWVSGRFRVQCQQTSPGNYVIFGANASGGVRVQAATAAESFANSVSGSGHTATISMAIDGNPPTTMSVTLSITTDSTTGRTTGISITPTGFTNGNYACVMLGGLAFPPV